MDAQRVPSRQSAPGAYGAAPNGTSRVRRTPPDLSRAFVDLHCHSKGSFDCLSARQ